MSKTAPEPPNARLADLPMAPGLEPMEAQLVDHLPEAEGWWFEPKWDGFRCLTFRSGEEVDLRAKSGKPLGRYFPEVLEMVRRFPHPHFVLDGELVIEMDGVLSFDALQMRLHPAESRITKLARETPAMLVLFDMLVTPDGRSVLGQPLHARRRSLETLMKKAPKDALLSPRTMERKQAQAWLEQSGGALDGVVAKRIDGRYQPGERAMLKVKCLRTADCVVGGFRYASNSRQVGSLLLGLYNDEGLLDHVGFTSTIPNAQRPDLTRRLEELVEPPGFTGKAPGGPSRWSTERSSEWKPLKPELVVEVRYDQVTSGRFRHGTRLLRWRPDKNAHQCRMDQLKREAAPRELIDMMQSA